MVHIFCSYCLRRGTMDPLPRGWKTCGDAVLCPDCRRRRYALRSITMTVAGPVGAAWRELGSVLESCTGPGPCHRKWEARLADGQPALRIRIGRRWWEGRLRSSAWSGARRAVFEKVASGAARGELFLFRAPSVNGTEGDLDTQGQIMCRIVAWVRRGGMGGIEDAPQDAPGRSDTGLCRFDTISIGKLREAIRANRVSFPSRVPAFAGHDASGLQPTLAELYFVRGWRIEDIGARCGLSCWRVREILNTWKRRAVIADCIQPVPAEAMRRSGAPPPDAAVESAQASFPVAGSFQGDSQATRGHKRSIEPPGQVFGCSRPLPGRGVLEKALTGRGNPAAPVLDPDPGNRS